MSAAELWPRLAGMTAFMFFAAGYTLLQPRPSDPMTASLYDMGRPVGYTALGVAILVAVITVFVWRHAQVGRDAFRRTGFTTNDLRRLSPSQFEEWCADRLREQGHRVTVVGGQSDHGIDLIAERDGSRMAVQCKRWFGIRLVGEPQVRDLLGAMQHVQATTGMVITTGQYSEAALKWVAGKPIRLWGVEELVAGSAPAAITPTIMSAAPRERCPSCGRDLLRRVNRRTQAVFWGCAGYPTCRFTRAV
jgi:restriction system protein